MGLALVFPFDGRLSSREVVSQHCTIIVHEQPRGLRRFYNPELGHPKNEYCGDQLLGLQFS
jgi:hypothetical protein